MELLAGTLLLRPYVFGFLAAFLIAGAADLGLRRTLGFAGVVWPLAWLAEFASTRWGVPFGLYHYTGDTRGRELYVANVPLMDSLSFTFLAYAAFCLARAAWRGRRPSSTALAVTAGGVMMLLDVVIDPVAVRGDRWFLGRIFFYAEPGAYFGVPLSNFAGWWLVGALGVGLWLWWTGWRARGAPDAGVREPGSRREWPGRGRRVSAPARRIGPGTGRFWPGAGLYYAVLAFNLAVTAWLGEWYLLAAGVTVHAMAGLAMFPAVLLRVPALPTLLWGGGIGRGAPPPSR